MVRFYKGGVVELTTTTVRSSFLVNVDGYNVESNYNGYWIVKMPYGTGYGEFGNIWFKKDMKRGYYWEYGNFGYNYTV